MKLSLDSSVAEQQIVIPPAAFRERWIATGAPDGACYLDLTITKRATRLLRLNVIQRVALKATGDLLEHLIWRFL